MRKRAPRIVVVGSTMIDLIAYADPLPKEGQTVTGSEFRLGFGGKGANQAVMAARLGGDVTFVNCVGDDVFGSMAVANLAEQGLRTDLVSQVAGATTGVAPIWVDGQGSNRIIVVPGANQRLDARLVESALSALARADCVVCQLEIPLDAVHAAFRFGREWGCPTILNPAPAPDVALPDYLLALVDWLIPNETEFEWLFGRAPSDEALETLTGPRTVVTLGAAGAAAFDGKRVRRSPAPAVSTVDTTGAGDAFVGGFAYAIASGYPLEEALRLANVCGALSVTRRGTQVSFPSRTAVDDLSARGLQAAEGSR